MIKLSHSQRESIGLRYVLDLMEPASAYGREALRHLQFYGPEDRAALQTELDNIERTLLARPSLEKEYIRMEHIFFSVKDLRRTIHSLKHTVPGEIELFEIKRYLLQLDEIGQLFSRIQPTANYTGIAFADTAAALQLLDPEGTRVATFHISGRYSARLTQLRADKQELEQQMREGGQLLREKLAAQRSALAAAEEAEEEIVRIALGEGLRPFIPALMDNAKAIRSLDLAIQKAKLAAARHCVKPSIGCNSMHMENMVNPVIADRLAAEGGEFTPVSAVFGKGTTVITGANMGGKSVVLKTTALNAALIHLGFYAFAEMAEIPLFDAIYLVSEDLEASDRGLSSFGGEIVRLGEITAALEQEFALVLLDEFARGTNPDEGAAIARAVAIYLGRQNAITVMTTHYDGVAAHAAAHYQIIGLRGVDIEKVAASLVHVPESERVACISREMNYGLFRVEGETVVSKDAFNICHLLKCNKEILNLVENTD